MFNIKYIFFSFLLLNCSANPLFASFHTFFSGIKRGTEKLINPSSDLNDLPSIFINKGEMFFSNNGSHFQLNNNTTIQILDSTKIDFSNFQNLNEYFIINLGNITDKWNLDLYDNFTTIIDNANKKNKHIRNLFGYLVNYNFATHSYNSLPYLKASVRDLKQYLIHKKYDSLPIGIYFDGNFDLTRNITDYLSCENKYKLNFIVKNNMFSTINIDSVNKSCTEVEISDINTDFLPYSPRSGRCDCIMSMINCIVNLTHNTTFLMDDDFLINEICETIYCGSILDDPKRGHYGVFSSCSNTQRYSIAFNLYYTFHKTNKRYCNFTDKAKIIKKEKSIDSFLKFVDFEGKLCKEEVLEDWNQYLLGVSKSLVDLSAPNNQNVYSYDDDFESGLGTPTNNQCSNKLQASVFFKLLLVNLILCFFLIEVVFVF